MIKLKKKVETKQICVFVHLFFFFAVHDTALFNGIILRDLIYFEIHAIFNGNDNM